jgi:cytochrome c5
LLNANCLQCHARENIGVPVMGNPEDWKKRNAQGEEALLRNAIQGVRGMPPLGHCAACTEEDLRALVQRVSGLDGGK